MKNTKLATLKTSGAINMKEQILDFLEWAEKTQASTLCYNDGYSVEYYLSPVETIELVDDYIKSQEEQ